MQLKTHQTGPEGQKVRRLYIEDGADIQKEYYCLVVTDRATQKVAFIASEGGMDIEEVAHSTPEKIITEFIDPLAGLTRPRDRRWPTASACRPSRRRSSSTSARSSTSATWTPTLRWWKSTR
jgi:succinyl-CoA synthetase beta subunit